MSFPHVHPDTISNIVAYLRQRVDMSVYTPDVGVICGSGLGGLADTITDVDADNAKVVISYADIPGFPQSTVHGHAGLLVFGKIGDKVCVAMKGRFHYYEGYEPSQVSLPVRVMAALGCRHLIVTNAAGGVDDSFNVGDVMILDDHVNFLGLAGIHPLRGRNDERFGPRFPALNNAYDADSIALLQQCARDTKFAPGLHRGCYYGLSGPTYETPHEIELVKRCGGHAVGMSTVFEVTVAAHSGVPCTGMSLITNKCVGVDDTSGDKPNHAEVLEAVRGTESHLQRLVIAFVSALDVASRARPPAWHHFNENPPVYTPSSSGSGGGCPFTRKRCGNASGGGSSGCCFSNGIGAAVCGLLRTGALVAGVVGCVLALQQRGQSNK